MGDEYDGRERRHQGHDIVTDLLADRIDAVASAAAKAHADTAARLDRHVMDCANLQKWVLRGIITMFAWVVAHSPEVMGLFVKIMATAAK